MTRTPCLPCCVVVALHIAAPEVVAVEPQGSSPPTAGLGLVVFRAGLVPRRMANQGWRAPPAQVDEALKQTQSWPLVQSGKVSAQPCYIPTVLPHGLACLLRRDPIVQLLELTGGSLEDIQGPMMPVHLNRCSNQTARGITSPRAPYTPINWYDREFSLTSYMERDTFFWNFMKLLKVPIWSMQMWYGPLFWIGSLD